MIYKLKKIIKTCKKKGLFETIVYGADKFLEIIFSRVQTLLLSLRGYSISNSVVLRGKIFFFQSNKRSITILEKSTVGNNSRISAGGNGIVRIGRNVLIDESTFIMAHESIIIGDNTTIAAFCFITDFNHKFNDKTTSVLQQGYKTKPIVIGKSVWIGTHCIILPGVKIGDGVVVGAGSVVTKNIPAGAIAMGNPAKVKVKT